jgi:hypothetical protein
MEPADGQAGSGRQGEVVTVKQVVACLQERGVLQQMQLSEAATAACLLHNTLAVTDPQGARYATLWAFKPCGATLRGLYIACNTLHQ